MRRTRLWPVIIILTVSGCHQQSEQERQKEGQANAQSMLDNMVVACRDGVEYLVGPWGNGEVITPYLQPDGRPYLCVHLQPPVDPD